MYLDRPHTLHKINSAWIINLNVKCRTIKHLENDIGENLDDLEYSNGLLDTIPKAWVMKEEIDQLGFVKASVMWQTCLREQEEKSQTGRKDLQKTYLIKHHYSTYTIKLLNATIGKQKIILKMGQKSGHLEEDILMTRSLWKDAPNYMLTELKIKTHLTEWSKSTTWATPDDGEDVGQQNSHSLLVKMIQSLRKTVSYKVK